MRNRKSREEELYNSGLVDSVKKLFGNRNDITEDYYVLIADYIDSMDEIKDEMLINPAEIAKRLPKCVQSIKEASLGGIHGRTDNSSITMEQSLNYENKKLYFFHELTHALQTFRENDIEKCGFYDGHDGMFFTEGATQYTAEMLYNVSNGTNLEHREQPGRVRGARNRTPNSPLSEYQYNGNVLELLAKSMDLPMQQVLALAYKKDGREVLKGIYESMEGKEGKFDELMNDLEKIYAIDKLLIFGYEQQLQTQMPINITMQDHTTVFKGNLNVYRELMDKTERELAATYLENHNTKDILENYNEISNLLTTPELKNNFLLAIQQLSQEFPQINNDEIQNLNHQHGQTEAPRYSINEYGEIIRPIKQMEQQSNSKQEKNVLTLKQKVAQFLHKNGLFMNFTFVENFVHKQLDVLPTSTQEKSIEPSINKEKEDFENRLTNFGEYRNLPPIQRMSDKSKLEYMQRRMQEDKNIETGEER